MDFAAMKRRAAFQVAGDAEEAAQMEPFASQYVNEGLERLCDAFGTARETLAEDGDAPSLPEWAHPAVADFASWMLCRNGNAQRQARGLYYRSAFEEAVARALREGGTRGKRDRFVNVYP